MLTIVFANIWLKGLITKFFAHFKKITILTQKTMVCYKRGSVDGLDAPS